MLAAGRRRIAPSTRPNQERTDTRRRPRQTPGRGAFSSVPSPVPLSIAGMTHLHSGFSANRGHRCDDWASADWLTARVIRPGVAGHGPVPRAGHVTAEYIARCSGHGTKSADRTVDRRPRRDLPPLQSWNHFLGPNEPVGIDRAQREAEARTRDQSTVQRDTTARAVGRVRAIQCLTAGAGGLVSHEWSPRCTSVHQRVGQLMHRAGGPGHASGRCTCHHAPPGRWTYSLPDVVRSRCGRGSRNRSRA
jgi:hypothetical protein